MLKHEKLIKLKAKIQMNKTYDLHSLLDIEFRYLDIAWLHLNSKQTGDLGLNAFEADHCRFLFFFSILDIV